MGFFRTRKEQKAAAVKAAEEAAAQSKTDELLKTAMDSVSENIAETRRLRVKAANLKPVSIPALELSMKRS